MKFQVPDKLSNDSVRRVLEEFESFRADLVGRTGTVLFDFAKCDFVGPVGMILLAAFEDILLEHGITPMARLGGGRRLNALLRVYEVVTGSSEKYEEALKRYAVEVRRCMTSEDGLEIANKILPHILAKTNCKRSTEAALNWVLWEIFDNAGVHGYECYETGKYPKPVYVCAGEFQDRVEIAVLDRGIGIQSSLRKRNPVVSAKRSLEFALHKGTSGHPSGSAGFGLYATSQLALRGGGSFYIWSSGAGLKANANGIKSFNCPDFGGTIVSLSLRRDMEAPFEEIIGRAPDDFFEDFLVR